jgi:hypothetical protein
MVINWKDVLDSSKLPSGFDVREFVTIARRLRYPAFMWNEQLYGVPENQKAEWNSEPLSMKNIRVR